MQIAKSLPHRKSAAGFTLPAILVVVGALLILAVGILLITGIERNTSRSFVDRERAELAARAGLEDLRGIFKLEAANDDFVILQSTLATAITPGRQPAPQLFLARGKAEGSAYSYRYIPLFSTKTLPQSNNAIAPPPVEPLVGATAEEHLDFTTLLYNDKVRASWLPIKDEKGRTVARYAYWVEDLQSRLDPAIVGNEQGSGGTHTRAAWPFPAAGLNPKDLADTEPTLDQVALYAIDPSATSDKQGDLAKTLIKNRKLLVSPDSLLAAAGIEPPLDRLKLTGTGKIGELSDPKSRAVEEALVAGLRSYKEQPLVPFAEGIDPSAAGKPKLNLNKLLATGGNAAVDEMAAWIKQGLPKFDDPILGRPGGFPDSYLKTLAANAIDYADVNGDATVGTDYRGIDSYPFVSETMLKARWDAIRTMPDKSKEMDISVTMYFELWNMSDQLVDGSMQMSYETKLKFQISPNPNFYNLGDMTYAPNSGLSQIDGDWYFPAVNVRLNPNEYRLFKLGPVKFTFKSNDFIASPLILGGETFGATKRGYKLRWNNRLVDQARGWIHRNDISLYYTGITKSRSQQRFRATIPGQSYSSLVAGLITNMGDPRMCYYIQTPQAANIYPQNISPNRRNIRIGSVYSNGTDTIYGRVLPSEWPDGGHDSPFGADSMFALNGMTSGGFDDNHGIEPDDAAFYLATPYDYAKTAELELAKKEAPMRISNLGRFYSATELGRVYDPIMWRVRTNTDTANAPGRPWGDVDSNSSSSPEFGGGNTLRIGRPEHPMFDKAGDSGKEAYHLLDLFHAGISRSPDVNLRNGNVIEIKGQVNINTVSSSTLRAILAGTLTQDPEIRDFTGSGHAPGTKKYPDCNGASPIPDPREIADRIADAIIRNRPYASNAAMAEAKESDNTAVFGNPKLFPGYTGSGPYPQLQWTDSAAEETFARAYEATTVRSRNFRVWVVGQALAPTTSTTAAPVVLSEVRRCYSVFADPGERKSDGSIDASKATLKILHENDY